MYGSHPTPPAGRAARRSAVREWLPKLLAAGGALALWVAAVELTKTTSAGRDTSASDLAALRAHSADTAHTAHTATGYKDKAYGTGNSATQKHTWPSTDPVAVSTFMLEYFPTTPWLIGNESWVDGGCATWGKVLMGNMTDATFQLHAVQAPVRPDGGLAVAQVEANFAAAVATALHEQRFTPLLDSNVGFYTEDLDFYVARFKCGGVKFLALEWPSAGGHGTSGDKYYSLLVHVPKSMVVVELMGAKLDANGLGEQPLLASDAPRLARSLPLHEAVADRTYSGRPALYPAKIGYVTADLDASSRFYENVLMTERVQEWNGTNWGFAGTSSVRMFEYPEDSAKKLVEVHYWSHDSANDAEPLAVQTLEGWVAAAHATEYKSNTDFFDQWMDWHYGHHLGATSTKLDLFVAAAEAEQSLYTIFTDYSIDTDSWAYYMYVASPGGQAVQLVGNFSSAQAAPSDVRVFDTCYAEGGYEFEKRSEVKARDEHKIYTEHPNFNTLGLALQHSDAVKVLDKCQESR